MPCLDTRTYIRVDGRTTPRGFCQPMGTGQQRSSPFTEISSCMRAEIVITAVVVRRVLCSERVPSVSPAQETGVIPEL